MNHFYLLVILVVAQLPLMIEIHDKIAWGSTDTLFLSLLFPCISISLLSMSLASMAAINFLNITLIWNEHICCIHRNIPKVVRFNPQHKLFFHSWIKCSLNATRLSIWWNSVDDKKTGDVLISQQLHCLMWMRKTNNGRTFWWCNWIQGGLKLRQQYKIWQFRLCTEAEY